MKIVFAVPWIEVEPGWGDRPEGYMLFLDKEQCVRETNRSSANGHYPFGNGYCGPIRPLFYIEVPFDSLEVELQEKLNKSTSTLTANYWKPKFASEKTFL